LDLSDLWILEVIFREGSLSEAAVSLNLSQPTLSRKVDRIESRLGFKVVQRGSTGAKLTPAGELLIAQGASVRRQMTGIEKQARQIATGDQRSLTVAMGPLIEQLLFPKLLQDFLEEQPGCQVSLKQMSADDMVKAVEEGTVDLALGPFDQGQVPASLIREALVSARIVFVARKGHPLDQGRESLNLFDVIEYPRIGPPLPEYMARQLPENLVRGGTTVECENYRICKNLVASSDYLTGGPVTLFREEIRQNTMVVLPVNYPVVWHSFALFRSTGLSDTADVFYRLAREHAEYLNQDTPVSPIE